jgi:hypothetical protein
VSFADKYILGLFVAFFAAVGVFILAAFFLHDGLTPDSSLVRVLPIAAALFVVGYVFDYMCKPLRSLALVPQLIAWFALGFALCAVLSLAFVGEISPWIAFAGGVVVAAFELCGAITSQSCAEGTRSNGR